MPQWRLEYCAKLFELTLLDQPREATLRAMLSNRSVDPDPSHAYANERVLVQLQSSLSPGSPDELIDLDPEALERAAAVAPAADTAALTEKTVR